jgi:nucleotide-binding universal stress UspA family protein
MKYRVEGRFVMGSTQRSTPAVVVAVDGRGQGLGALRFAIDEARARGTGVRLVHVLDRDDTGLVMDPYMTEACVAAPDVDFDWRFRRGPLADELVAAAGAGDLLVLGQTTPWSPERPGVGAVITEIAARTVAAVVVVPADWRARHHDRIVVGVKSCANAGGLLARAFAESSARGAALEIVHVCDAPDPAAARVDVRSGDRGGDGTRSLEALVRDWSDVFPGVAVETSFTHGQPARVLIDAATDADLLMIARHQRDLLHPARLGPTPRAVLGASDVPVEVVPLTGAPTTAPLVLVRSGTILKN